MKGTTAMAMTHAWHDIVHDMKDEMHDLATITHVDAARQAYLGLWATFIAVPLVFGIDAFAAYLNETWETYLATWANDMLPGSASDAVALIGVVTLVLAAAVAVVPRIGGDLLALWLVLLAINLFAIEGMAWLGVGTVALALCCVAMARMSTAYHHKEG
jgi:hypothetical protein